MKVQLGITYMRCGIAIDADLAAGAVRQADGTVLLPHATELLERQWQRDLAAQSGLPGQTEEQKQATNQTDEDPMKTRLMNEEGAEGANNGGGAEPAAATAPLTPPPAAPETSEAAEVPAEQEQPLEAA